MVAAIGENAHLERAATSARPYRERRLLSRIVQGTLVLTILAPTPAFAVKRDSPEVLALVDKGLEYLKDQSHPEVGGKCLIGLAFYKRGMKDHPRIKEAVESCRNSVQELRGNVYNYSKALAIIFLTEVDSDAHRDLIHTYADMLRDHQKPHGGFGYLSQPTGDTSQTQYAALAYWHMLNHGIAPDASSVQKCLNWLMRTRDPSGVWGYQGIDPGSFELVKQTDKPGVSMAAAGMSGVMILGNAVGLLKPGRQPEADAFVSNLPAALRREQDPQAKRVPTLPAGDVDPRRLAETVAAGRNWYEKNFTIQVHEYQSYYLYSIERYMSFQEYLEGAAEEEPDWYNKGYQFLKESQAANGSWTDDSRSQAATAPDQ